MKTPFLAAALLLGMAGATDLKPYGNARFNFWVHVPPAVVALRPSDNGDGQTWQSRDGRVKVVAWGSYSPDVLGVPLLKDYAAYITNNEAEAGSRVTYKKLLAGAFVLSGYQRGGNIFYQKTLVRDGTEATVRIEYPVSQRGIWDKLSGEIAATLKWRTR